MPALLYTPLVKLGSLELERVAIDLKNPDGTTRTITVEAKAIEKFIAGKPFVRATLAGYGDALARALETFGTTTGPS